MMAKLGDYISIKHGFAFKGEGITTDDNGIVLVTPGNFAIGGGFKEEKCKFFDGEYPSEYVLSPDDLIVTMTDLSKEMDTLGYSALVPLSNRIYLHNQRIGLISINSEEIDKHYLYWFMRTKKYQRTIAGGASGTAVHHTSPSRICDVIVEFPNKFTQKKIASILDDIEEKMKRNEEINENLEQQAASYFQHLFIENADPSWSEGTISDLGTVVGGSTPSKSKPEYYTNHGIAWITPKDLSVDKSKFIAHGADDITELGLRNSSASVMPSGTVLFSSRAPIGYIAIADGEVTTNQGFKSVVPKESIGTAFIYYFLKNALPTIENMASGSTFKEISGSAMRTVPAIIPDHKSIQDFTDFCDPLFQQQRTLEAENRQLSLLRDSLLPKLMSGELDVSEIDI